MINGGHLLEPYLVQSVTDAEGNVVSYHEPKEVRQVISQETSDLVRSYMESVVNDPGGTGKNAKVEGYHIGGKTGSSQTLDSKDHIIVSFLGFAPADDPQVIILLAYNSPKPAFPGSNTTAGGWYISGGNMAAIMAGELLYPEKLWDHLAGILEWKNLTLERVYGAKPYTMDDLKAWVTEFGEKIKPFICDTGAFLRQAQAEGKHILFEAQLGSLRDLDYGIYPYTTSSNPIAAYAPVGSGLPTAKLDKIIGVVKAYSSCVGEGPFTCEWFGEEAEKLREAGGEYGAKTGWPRRVGPIDIVATRYGIQCQGATDIALTKLDVLSYMDEIPICARYELNGQETDAFPFPAVLPDAKPVMTAMPGWKCDISGVRKWENLPEAARNYVEYVEREIGCHITYVSVGPERDSIIIR